MRLKDKIKTWTDSIVQQAGERLVSVYIDPNKTVSDLWHIEESHFWTRCKDAVKFLPPDEAELTAMTFAKEDGYSAVAKLINPKQRSLYTLGEARHAVFKAHATPAQKAEFDKRQRGCFSRFWSELKNVPDTSADILKRLDNISYRYGLSANKEKIPRVNLWIMDIVFGYPDEFMGMPAYQFLFGVMDMALAEAQERQYQSLNQVAWKIQEPFEKKYGLDLFPGQIERILHFHPRKSEIGSYIDGIGIISIPDKIKMGMPDLDAVPERGLSSKTPSLKRQVQETFRNETKRPAKEKREKGGRAGLGEQKPKLWNP